MTVAVPSALVFGLLVNHDLAACNSSIGIGELQVLSNDAGVAAKHPIGFLSVSASVAINVGREAVDGGSEVSASAVGNIVIEEGERVGLLGVQVGPPGLVVDWEGILALESVPLAEVSHAHDRV